MEKIFYKKQLVGIKITKINKGSHPITDTKEYIQLVTLKHSKGSYLKAHTHAPKRRVTKKLQEVIVVTKGKIRADLYNDEHQLFKNIFISAGQVFILLNGGIGIHFLQDSEIIEIKNGPFLEDKLLI